MFGISLLQRGSQNVAYKQEATLRHNETSEELKPLQDPAKSVSNRRVSQPHSTDEAQKFGGYTRAELDVLQQLKARDREVRAHEAAHAAVGGQYAGSPKYSYQRGPDGQNYAIGGKVSIDLSSVSNDPEATIRKMDIVRRAALAPAQPSGQDRRVAQEAAAKKQQAQVELNKEVQQQRQKSQNDSSKENNVINNTNESEHPNHQQIINQGYQINPNANARISLQV